MATRTNGTYGFKNGKLTTTFELDAYVGVKNLNNNHWYMTDGYAGEVQSATLYNTDTYTFTGTDPLTAKDKLHIPAGVEVTITMVYNAADDTVTLSYETTQEPTTEQVETTVPETIPETDPTSEAPTEATTEAPTTEPVTETAEPTTAAPTTEEPTTAAPTTEEPTTAAPTTEEPTTEAPTTAEPTTEAPTTEPATQAPTAAPAKEKQKENISNWNVVGIKNVTYTGKEIKQNIVVTNGTAVATVSTIYTNNKNAGTATVVIQGTGDYEGTIVKTFTINKASQKFKATAKTKTVKAKKLKKDKVKLKNVIKVKNAKGTVKYKKAEGFKLIKVNSNGVITLNKGKYKKKSYTIRVTVTASGNSNYKSSTKTIKVKIKIKK